MASGAFTVYDKFRQRVMQGDIDLDGHVFKMLLLTSGYTPNVATQLDLADIVANEHAATGNYARQTLATLVVSLAAGVAKWDFDDVDFGSNTTITAKYAAIYDDTHASDGLVGYFLLDSGGANVSSAAASFKVLTPNGALTSP